MDEEDKAFKQKQKKRKNKIKKQTNKKTKKPWKSEKQRLWGRAPWLLAEVRNQEEGSCSLLLRQW